jgi:succinate dehydrogenase/fumarate reductase cytochrome b subunit
MIKQTAELFEKLFSVIVVLGYVFIGIMTIAMLFTEAGIVGIAFGIGATLLWIVQLGAIAMFIMIWKNTTSIAEKLEQSKEAE